MSMRDAGDAPAVLGEDPHRALGVVQHLGPSGVGEPGGERLLVGLVQLRRVEPGGRPRRRRRARPRRPSRCPAPTCRPWPRRGPRAVLGEPAGASSPAPSTVPSTSTPPAATGVPQPPRRPGPRRTAAPAARGSGSPGCPGPSPGPCGRRRALQVRGRLRQLDVAHHLGQPAVELDGLQVVAEVLPGLALDLLGALDQLRERTELVDPLRGGLLADAGDARQVVGRVAAQRREVGVLRGRQAVLLEDLLRGEAGQLRDALGRIQHRDVRR